MINFFKSSLNQRGFSVMVIGLLFAFFGRAQESNRISIEGLITAPQEQDVEGVTVYNISSQKGTVTSKTGNFTLKVAEHDRIHISALQFSEFTVIIDAEVIASKQLKIYLDPSVNQLDEVIVRPHDLTGNIIVDAQQIKTHIIPNIKLSVAEMYSKQDMAPDQWSAMPGNTAMQALGYSGNQGVSVDLAAIARLLIRKKSKSVVPKNQNRLQIAEALKARFNSDFLYTEFKIPKEKGMDFLYFVEDSGLLESYLKPENELELLIYMRETSVAYLSESEK